VNEGTSLRKLIVELIDRRQLESGQTMAEYAVALTVISATTILAFSGLASKLSELVTSVAGLLP
jgi:Flp pilus assembly pilin Flp